MPVSTEQIMFPDRYLPDQPLPLSFTTNTERIYEDVLGESEIHILMAHLMGRQELREIRPAGWGGDRYRVLATPSGPALVWYLAWDDKRSADRFTWGFGGKLRQTSREGYRTLLETFELDGKPVMRYVLAPVHWDGWGDVPTVAFGK
jgi:hypothetical protein